MTVSEIVARAADVAAGPRQQAVLHYPHVNPTKSAPGRGNPFSNIAVPVSRYSELYTYADEQRIASELYGQRGVIRLNNMAALSPMIGAFHRLLTDRATDSKWTIEPGPGKGGGGKNDKRIEFLKQVYFEDLNRPFFDVVGEALTNFVTGWTWFEVTYKRRLKGQSKFDDGKIGIRSIAKLVPESIHEFLVDDSYEIVAATQILDGNYVSLPIGKSLLFRYGPERDPRGKTPMVNAYKSYCRQRVIEETESAGIENDATGMPVINVDTSDAQGANIWADDDESRKTLAALQEMVKQIRGGQRTGLVLPHWQTADLLKTGGSRSFDAHLSLSRHDSLILTPFLASHFLLPQGKTGSYSLAETLQKVLDDSIDATIQRVASTFSWDSIPVVLELNGMPTENAPVMKVKVKKHAMDGQTPPRAPQQRKNYDADPKKQPGPGNQRRDPKKAEDQLDAES